MESTTLSQQGQVPNVPMLQPAEVRRRIESGQQVRFIDARGEEDWNAFNEKLRGAIRYSKGHPLSTLPRSQSIVTYCTCPHDEAARSLAQDLINKGYKAYALEGGFNLWKSEGLPLEDKPSA